MEFLPMPSDHCLDLVQLAVGQGWWIASINIVATSGSGQATLKLKEKYKVYGLKIKIIALLTLTVHDVMVTVTYNSVLIQCSSPRCTSWTSQLQRVSRFPRA